ncbi:Asp-tRNA(Asn)/Glu-tRNA(Gln) amidotransferase subunit GatC [Candidatus Saccharibacteria bacterium]|nr:Asp-tRNA(Asn)/Glu-tRNA(Gln) amidotransferase subunit GatC [Candidatus Saccharibacteria bacterium]
MADITIEDVKKVARLSGLTLTDTECETYREQFAEILGYFDRLKAVDTTGLEPTYQVTGLANVTREDKLIDYGVDQAGLLANVPAAQDKQIKVPRVIE